MAHNWETFEHQLTANSCHRTARSKSEYFAPGSGERAWHKLMPVKTCEESATLYHCDLSYCQPGAHRTNKASMDIHGFWHPFGILLASFCLQASDLQVVEMWNCTLRSLNRLDFAACAALGEGLRDNHSLYGLHVVGNLPSKTHKQRH